MSESSHKWTNVHSLSILVITEMARDSSVGRERVLVVQGGMHSLENAAQSQPSDSIDINQQILEVSTNMFVYLYSQSNSLNRSVCIDCSSFIRVRANAYILLFTFSQRFSFGSCVAVVVCDASSHIAC